MNAHQAARALGGRVCGRNKISAPGPGHSKHDQSMLVTLLSTGYVVHSFAGDDWKTCRQHVNDRLGLAPRYANLCISNHSAILHSDLPAPSPDIERVAKFERAKRLWTQSAPLSGTLGHTYLTQHRGLDVDRLQLDHALKWHGGERCIVARVVYPLRNEAAGVHRIYLHSALWAF